MLYVLIVKRFELYMDFALYKTNIYIIYRAFVLEEDNYHSLVLVEVTVCYYSSVTLLDRSTRSHICSIIIIDVPFNRMGNRRTLFAARAVLGQVQFYNT